MAFIEGSKIFTDSGWKSVETIAGRDKVLVRNFLGDAEFIQPFALKKKYHKGQITKIGGKTWSFSVTPDHIVVYDRKTGSGRSKFRYEKAKDLKIDKNYRIYRKFKYLAAEEYKKENVVFKTPFGKKWVNISNQDWYVLVAYVLCRAYMRPEYKKHVLNIRLDRQKVEKEVRLLGDILDRIGAEWSFIPTYVNDTSLIRVSAKTPLAKRLITRLGSADRREMYLPDSMIYKATRELATTLIETVIDLSKRPTTERGDFYQFTSNNEKLIHSLEMLGTVWGYGMTIQVMEKKGIDYGRGVLRKDVLKLNIRNLPESYSPRYVKNVDYEGSVYEIDLFDGQVYVKEGTAPVWVNPK